MKTWFVRLLESLPMQMFLPTSCESSLSDINYNTTNQFQLNNWSLLCVMLSKLTLNTEANVHLVSRFCTWDGISTTAINCINRIQAVTTVDGKQLVLATMLL